jgi:hypothetical protein
MKLQKKKFKIYKKYCGFQAILSKSEKKFAIRKKKKKKKKKPEKKKNL